MESWVGSKGIESWVGSKCMKSWVGSKGIESWVGSKQTYNEHLGSVSEHVHNLIVARLFTSKYCPTIP